RPSAFFGSVAYIRLAGNREQDGDHGTAPFGVGQQQFPVVRRDDGVHDGQAEARAVILGGKEGIKKLVQQGGRETGAAVVERELDHAVVTPYAADADDPAASDGLIRVDQDVVDGPVQQILVPKDEQGIFRITDALHAEAFHFAVEEAGGLIQQRVDIHAILTGHAGAGIVEEVVDDLAQA